VEAEEQQGTEQQGAGAAGGRGGRNGCGFGRGAYGGHD